jgi:hypothetical protein
MVLAAPSTYPQYDYYIFSKMWSLAGGWWELGDRISTVIGCPGVMTILSHEVAMTGPPAEVLCPPLLAGFVVRKSYCTSLCL